jgi:hypothetical protein
MTDRVNMAQLSTAAQLCRPSTTAIPAAQAANLEQLPNYLETMQPK